MLASSWETAETDGRGYKASLELQNHLNFPLLPVRTKDVPLRMTIRTEVWTEGSEGSFRKKLNPTVAKGNRSRLCV